MKKSQKQPRGYYQVKETEWYYLQSRYYDPIIHRFINADSQIDQNAAFVGLNLFAYCANNPTIYKDDGGTCILTCIIVGAIIGAAVGCAIGAGQAGLHGHTSEDGWAYWNYVVGYGVLGAACGAFCGYGVGSYMAASAASALSWSAYSATAQIGTSAYAIGHAFEEWFYKTYNVVQQQVACGNSRFDAILNNRIYELKNYDWSKYEYYSNMVRTFTTQARKYLEYVDEIINGVQITGVTFYFSSRPPQQIIDALEALGVFVDWAN